MTPLEKMSREGLFAEASEEMVVREIRTLVMNTECETEIMSDSASNLCRCTEAPLRQGQDARHDRCYISGFPAAQTRTQPARAARLVYGQYGDITDDIAAAIAPMISGGSLNFSGVSDSEIESATRLIRSKLMP
jgi:hypothetical protein